MLQFAKSLISPKPSPSVLVPKDLLCDFFILDGERWLSLADGKCRVIFETAPKLGSILRIYADDDSVSELFSLDSISQLQRFSDDDGKPCFQWIARKGKGGDNLDEFGARFESEQEAEEFASKIVCNSQQSAEVLLETNSAIALLEKSKKGDWELIRSAVKVFVSKTKRGDRFMTVESDKDGEALFHSLLSAALQLELDADSGIVSFLGLTPLTEDLRVLGLEVSDQNELISLSDAFSIPSAKVEARRKGRLHEEDSSSGSESESSDVEMWEAPDEYRSVPIKSRKVRGKKPSDSGRNKFLETGHADDSRAFVFSLSADKGLGYKVLGEQMQSVSTVSRIGGKSTIKDPSTVMLHEGDSKCLLLDPTLGRDTVFELDLERGQIVSEWTPSTGSITALLPVSKEAQKTGEKTFLGINDRSIFAIDPRMQPKEHTGNRAYSFTYASNIKLSSATTDKEGHIVAANKTGEMRLFDGLTNKDGDLKKAKTLLAGLGDPITHVEISANGEYILATTANYLTLTRTSVEGTSGFVKSISNSGGEPPIVLSLTPSDIAKFGLKNIQFTPARFDERRGLIVTSTGSLAILFDMKRLPNYSVKPMSDYIVDIDRTGTGVVAMYEDRVELARTRK
jgi:hypothetical protein